MHKPVTHKIVTAALALQMVTAGTAFAQAAWEPRDNDASAGFGTNLPASAGHVPASAGHLPASAANANNTSFSASALSGKSARPAPGAFLVRMGGRVNVQAGVGSAR
jgi:hypothetical protein